MLPLLLTYILTKELPEGTAVCNVCEYVVKAVDNAVNSGFAEEEIEGVVLPLCQKLAQPYSAFCENMVRSTLPQILRFLDQELDALNICKRMGLCVETKRRAARPAISETESDTKTCALCTTLVDMIEKYLEDGKTAEAIEGLVLPFCSSLKQPMTAVCEMAVKMYIPQIISYLDQELKALDICKKIGFCKDLLRDDPEPEPDYCSFCNDVVAGLKVYLADDTNINEIKDFLIGVINTFPDDLKEELIPMINIYLPLAVEAGKWYIDEHKPCIELGFCTE